MTRWWLFQSCNRLNTRNNDTVYHHLNGYPTGKSILKHHRDFNFGFKSIQIIDYLEIA